MSTSSISSSSVDCIYVLRKEFTSLVNLLNHSNSNATCRDHLILFLNEIGFRSMEINKFHDLSRYNEDDNKYNGYVDEDTPFVMDVMEILNVLTSEEAKSVNEPIQFKEDLILFLNPNSRSHEEEKKLKYTIVPHNELNLHKQALCDSNDVDLVIETPIVNPYYRFQLKIEPVARKPTPALEFGWPTQNDRRAFMNCRRWLVNLKHSFEMFLIEYVFDLFKLRGPTI